MGIPIVCSFSVFCYQNNGVKEPTRSEFPTANSKSSLMTDNNKINTSGGGWREYSPSTTTDLPGDGRGILLDR